MENGMRAHAGLSEGGLAILTDTIRKNKLLNLVITCYHNYYGINSLFSNMLSPMFFTNAMKRHVEKYFHEKRGFNLALWNIEM